jgi:hypothetical protein
MTIASTENRANGPDVKNGKRCPGALKYSFCATSSSLLHILSTVSNNPKENPNCMDMPFPVMTQNEAQPF